MKREELQRLASFPELNASPIFELDQAGRLIYQNVAARKNLPGLDGHEHPAIAGLVELAVGLRDSGPSLREVLVGDRTYEQQISLVGAEGLIRVYMIDVTARKEVEAELKAYRDRLEFLARQATAESNKLASVVRQSTESIVITDLSGNIEYVNPAFERITGYTAGEALGKNPHMLRADRASYPPGFYQNLWKTISGGSVWRGEFTNQKKNGEIYIEEAVIFPIKEEKTGEILRFGAVKSDVTRRRELEDKLRDSFSEMVGLKEQAEEASRSKSEFLAHMSHEIRTPLNGIIGFLQLLGQSSLDDQQKEFVSTTQKSAQNLLGIINDILDLSKIESGRLELEELEFDPTKELESVVDLFSSSANEGGIEFYSFIDPALPRSLIGDPLRLKQILTNFIGNSLKFTERGKAVSVDIRLLETRQDRCRIGFLVEDQGIGIPPEKQKMILEAFTQADTSVSRKFGGTGLGLAINNKLISQMGGVLHLESHEGRGSRFSFELEIVLGSEPKEKTAPAREIRVGLVGNRSREPEQLVAEYLQALEYQFYWLPAEPPDDLPELDALVLIYREEDAAVVRRYSALDPPIVLVAEEKDRSAAEKLAASSGVRPLYSPVYGSKLYDALAAVRVVGNLPETLTSASPQPKPVVSRGRALVAEDNAVNQKLITYMLRDVGLVADVAPDGAQAVALFQTGGYSIVFMDASMPVLDGIAATQQILEFERMQSRAHTPIVALTAHAIKGDRERFLEAGMDDYLPKPINLDALEAVLERQLGP